MSCQYQIIASGFDMDRVLLFDLMIKIAISLSWNNKLLNHHQEDKWIQMEILKIFHNFQQINLKTLSPICNNHFSAA